MSLAVIEFGMPFTGLRKKLVPENCT